MPNIFGSVDNCGKEYEKMLECIFISRWSMLYFNFDLEPETPILTKVLSPVSSMIKFWMTTFWFLWNIKHRNHATFMNQKVVIQNFIIELTGNKYFSISMQKLTKSPPWI